MEKEEEKKLLADYKQQRKKEFEDSLPMPRETFLDLFDFLDQELESLACPDDFSLIRSFLKEDDVDFEVILYSMKIKEQTRKLAEGCSKHCFEIVDKTDEVSSKYYFEVAGGS